MTEAPVTLDDKYLRRPERVFLTGTQALVRLPLEQRWRDEAAGLNTAGFVSGYRGSPLGDYDRALWQAARHLERNGIRFQPAVNEELAATAVIGTQQLNMYPGARRDGVFAIWYGKGPGADRAGDALKHLNSIGTTPHGGVLIVVGDDHGAESSSLAHQCEQLLSSWLMPLLNPASVHDYLAFGLFGWAMSRYSGCAVGFKATASTVGSSASIAVAPDAPGFAAPTDFEPPPGGLHPRWPDWQLDQEARLHNYKLPAARAFARANGIDRVMLGAPDARIGIVATGKAYLDLRQALEDLGADESWVESAGIGLYKVGMSWPLETQGALAFADGLDEIIVIEEKRSFVESQLKEALYHLPADRRPRIVGKTDADGAPLLPTTGELNPALIARALAPRLPLGELEERARAHLAFLDQKAMTDDRAPIALRTPYFCSGCPHNISTRTPEGSRTFAGTGCHLMAAFMERETSSFLHMGAEGANWIGQAPFTETPHVFQNLGDGTFVHSGSLALRQAVAAGVNITYKILFNDAVAMTGGQPFEGGLTVPDITRLAYHEGVRRIAVVADEIYKYPVGADFAPGVTLHRRGEFEQVQGRLRDWPGVSVLVYDQTCAAELRRRRKRGRAPEPTTRVYINDLVCEGCGDCSVQSNCISVVPRDTWLGRKRAIDQSSCNRDFSCLDGLCPAFVTLEGAIPRVRNAGDADPAADLPAPELPALDGPYGILVAGIGGTGVITVGQILAMAAHIDGKGVSTLDVAGLAQKGAGVTCHVRISDEPDTPHAARIPPGGGDLLLGGDMVLSATPGVLTAARRGRTRAAVNTSVAATAQNVLDPDFVIDTAALRSTVVGEVGEDCAAFVDATGAAEALTGDSIAANIFLLGYAFQRGWVPLSLDSLRRAFELNGVAVADNLRSFNWGRLAARDPARAEETLGPLERAPPVDETLDDIVARRSGFLSGYQDAAYAQRYDDLVETVRTAESGIGGGTPLTEAVARSYFRLLAYKDEFEVARLYTESGFLDELREKFSGDYRVRVNLAPPLLSPPGPVSGRPQKRALGRWIWPAMRLLARLRRLRGGALDIFGYTAERRLDRTLIADYEVTVQELLAGLKPSNRNLAVEIARLPQRIRGFGRVKADNAAAVRREHARLMGAFKGGKVVWEAAQVEPEAYETSAS